MVAERTYTSRASMRKSYKELLIEQQAENSIYLSQIDTKLQEMFHDYFRALKGEYTYTDTHTGKTIHARTYRKRIEFAEEQLQKMEASLLLQTVGQEHAKNLINYSRTLYNITIRDNSYLKRKNTKKTAVAGRLRKSMKTLEDLVSQGFMASVPPKVEEQADATFQPSTMQDTVFTSQQEITSSPLYNRLRQIDKAQEEDNGRLTYHDKVALSRPQAKRSDFSTYGNVENIKLGDEDPTPWPWSREQMEQRKTKREKEGILSSLLGALGLGMATTAIALAGAFYTSERHSSTNTDIQKQSYIQQPVQPMTLSYVQAQKEDLYPAMNQKKIFTRREINLPLPTTPMKEVVTQAYKMPSTQTEEIYLNQAKARVEAAMKEIEAEKAALRLEKKIEGNAHGNTIQLQKKERSTSNSARDIILKIWERRSRERKLALNLPVVKEVTYYPSGEVITRYPSGQNRSYASSE